MKAGKLTADGQRSKQMPQVRQLQAFSCTPGAWMPPVITAEAMARGENGLPMSASGQADEHLPQSWQAWTS